MATITFHGAAQEVTGSCYQLRSSGIGNILLECGLHQGGDNLKRMEQEQFKFNPAELDAVILSHAHLDHCGLLPRLCHQGFDGPIFTTEATADLLRIMLYDALGLYMRDLEQKNRKLERQGKPLLSAQYNEKDVEQVLSLCVTTTYEHPIAIGDDARVTFFDAGHILGSSIVQLVFQEHGKRKKLVFSGDLGRRNAVLMNDPHELTDADILLVESTYGNRDHRSIEDTEVELEGILHDTWEKGGNVIIPSFAVGRTQELLFHLGVLLHQGKLDNWKVFLDSPMAIEVTAIYEKWVSLLAPEDVARLGNAPRGKLQRFLPNLTLSISADESMAINKIAKGALIIAGSGMCNGGRIRHHLKHRIWNRNNCIIFVGFQAEGTLGRALVDGSTHARMFGEQVVVRANIATLGGFSAHAGQRGLIDWISNFTSEPRIVLVHGELLAQQTLADKLWEEKQIRVSIPARGEMMHF